MRTGRIITFAYGASWSIPHSASELCSEKVREAQVAPLVRAAVRTREDGGAGAATRVVRFRRS